MSVTSRVEPLQETSAAPTLAQAMEPLRLFIPETLDTTLEESVTEPPRKVTAVPIEHLEAAEHFLQTRSTGAEPLPTIQAAILVCEGAGDISEDGLEVVRVDEHVFPLAAAAVEWTRRTLSSPHASWPEGFWPRFLLGVLTGEQPGR